MVIKNGKILLARQNNRPFWVFPGGTLELEEGLEECAVREIKEETNLDITIKHMLYVADFIQGEGKHTIDVFFLAEEVTGEIKMETTENLNDLRYFSPEEIDSIQVAPELVSQQFFKDWQNNTLPKNNSAQTAQYLGKYTP